MSDILQWTPHIGKQRHDGLLGPIYSSCVPIQDITLKTSFFPDLKIVSLIAMSLTTEENILRHCLFGEKIIEKFASKISKC